MTGTPHKATLRHVEAVLLDMDGTLVNSDAAIERAWVVWSEEYGVDASSALAIGFGGSPEHAVRQLLPHLDGLAVAAAAARQLALQYDDLSDIARTPGTTAFLTALDQLRLPWAVVTSADMRLARGRLDAVAIHAPLIITMEDVAEGKPHPDCYILAAAELGVAPSHCLVVEDTEPGVAAGRSAGATVAALKGVPGDLSVHDLGELVHLIMEAWNRTE